MAEVPELLPCPFCGGRAEQKSPDQPHGGMVNCTCCGAEAFGPKWNRRADRLTRQDPDIRRAALEEADGWQPIEAVPVNTRIEIGAWFEDDSSGYFGGSCWKWIVSGVVEGAGLWIDVNDEFTSQPLAELAGFDKPTHWRPLPAPPRALDTEAGNG